ncbi:MAG: LysM peptidoglycan-binding domain-containing protein [Endomicrobia bacterium]|nr:LysM peptidoglycan-binding domain-containing protein [Endomicrobiia bacterium]
MKYLNIIFIFLFSLGYCYNPVENFSAENFRLNNTVAKDDSVSCIFLNPAGLWNLKVPEITFTYGLIYPNLTDGTKFVNNSLGANQKLLNGIVGFGFNQFGIIDWYIKNKIILSYGRQLKELIPKVALGVKFTYDRETYNLDDYMKQNPVFSKTSEISYFSASLGGLYMFNEFNYLGILIENIFQPNVGLYTKENIPMCLNFGYKYEYKNIKVFPNLKIEFSSLMDYIFAFSFEYKFLFFNKKIKLTPSFGIGYGKNDYSSISLGFGFYTSQISFNYAYMWSPLSKVDTGGIQCFSLNYKFLPVEVEEEKISKKEYYKLLLEKQQLEEQIKSFTSKQPMPTEEELTPTLQPPQPQQPSTTEEILLKKLEELEKKLKEAESRKIEEKPKPQQPTTTSPLQPTVPKKRYHTVVEGDTLPKLAEKYYGNPSEWRRIYEANKDKIIRGQLVPGSVLEIP